jgi:hypothetical protein
MLPCSSDYIMSFDRGARGGNYCRGRDISMLPPSPCAVCRSMLPHAMLRAKHMGLSGNIAESAGHELTTPVAVPVPSPVGSSSSRYTFKGVSTQAWLGIVLGPLSR